MSGVEVGLAVGGANSLAWALREHGAVVSGSVPIDPGTGLPVVEALVPCVRQLAGHPDVVAFARAGFVARNFEAQAHRGCPASRGPQ